MDLKKKKICIYLTVIAFAMMIVASVLNVDSFIEATEGRKGFISHNDLITLVLSEVALVSAFIYCLKNFQKKASIYLKIFTGSFLLMDINFFRMSIVSAVNISSEKQLLLHLFVLVLLTEYSAVLLLTFAKNQGKHTSKFLAAIAAIANICIMFYFIIEEVSASLFVFCIAKILMLILFYLLIEAKYQDKDIRGTV